MENAPLANIDRYWSITNELPNTTSALFSFHRHCATPDNAEDGQSRLKEPREAATRSQSRPFFTRHAIFDADGDSDDDVESEDDGNIQVEDRGNLKGDMKSLNVKPTLWKYIIYSDTLILKKNGLQNAVVLFLRVNGNEKRAPAAVARSKHVQVWTASCCALMNVLFRARNVSNWADVLALMEVEIVLINRNLLPCM